VAFGVNAATSVVVMSATTITCTSPSGVGQVDVIVTDAGGTSAANANDKFSYTPSVTNVSPNSGPAAGGTPVTITGTGFVSGATVAFGVNSATSVVVMNATTITCTSPAGTLGATVDVIVTDAGGTSAANANDKFTYNNAPTVTNVNPNSGPTAGGTPVTITGTGFVSGATVAFGVNAATSVVVMSATTITCTSPAGVGQVDVIVTDANGASTANANDKFSYTPSVTNVSPNSGPAAGGTPVTITGTGFVSGATVAFGVNAATSVVVMSATTITCTSPAGTAGTMVDVIVTDAGGTSTANANDKFTYNAAATPTVTGLSPTSGPGGGGTPVTITGTNFVSGATVSFGGNAASNVVVMSATTITCTSPAGTGVVDVIVTDANGTSTPNANDKFSYVAPSVVNYLVKFGSQTYDLVANSLNRIRLPWQISSIVVVFSEPITTADANSLTGLSTTGVSGLGTNTLTWSLSAPLLIGSFMTMLQGSGADAIKDAGGNGLTGGSGYAQNFKVLLGDVNDDGVVSIADVQLAYNATFGSYNIIYDVNGDGVVNMTDVTIIRGRIGTSQP
jgi:hypothetical protein